MEDLKEQYQKDFYEEIKRIKHNENLLEQFGYWYLAYNDTYGEYIFDEKNVAWKYHFLLDYIVDKLNRKGK